MIRKFELFLALCIAAMLGACASGAVRLDGATTAAPIKVDRQVKSISLWLNDEAKKLASDNAKFDQEALRGTIERSLSAQDLIRADAGQTMDIEITSFRVRSNFSAIMFGFMAGSDNIEGVVTVKDASGNVLKRAKVNASYALGGLAGGQDGARMGWLYEAFSKHTVAEVAGPSGS